MSKKCTPLWREAHFEVKMYKAHHVQSTCGSSDVEKVHAVLARSTFRSQNCKKTHGFGALFDIQMSFSVEGARDSAHCQKWAKSEGFVAQPPLNYTTLHYTPLHYNYNILQLQQTTTTPTLHYTTLHYTPLHYIQLHCTALHCTTLTTTTTTATATTTLHYAILHYTNYTTLHYTTLH